MKNLTPLLQHDILGMFLADPVFAARPFVALEPQWSESEIQKEVAAVMGQGTDGLAGVGGIILPIINATDDDVSNPFGPLKWDIYVELVSNVEINLGAAGTGVPVRAFGRRGAHLLKLYTPVGFTQSLVAASPCIHEYNDPDNPGVRIVELHFTAREADDEIQFRVNRPQITVSGADYPFTVTVAGDSNTSTLWWTIDNSHPRLGNPSAKLYTQPVVIAGPCLFRVRAFGPDDNENIFGSDTAAQNFK